MKSISISISGVQHIKDLNFSLDLDVPGIFCVVGRNGAGKTTLVRSFKNLSSADTFLKTAGARIFSAASSIGYKIDDQAINYSYDPDLQSISSRLTVSDEIRKSIYAELSMPFGARFSYHQAASEADSDLRRFIATGKYTKPDELCDFLNKIYKTDRYDSLVKVESRGLPVYALLQSTGYYIREDYLSSGEYFLINLYRTIIGAAELVVVDEIDLSLDAAAQAELAGWLRGFCEKYGVVILFTTHSLAMMKTLRDGELFYMQDESGVVTVIPASYSYVNARLFGFHGWDRYILTEDSVLSDYIQFIIDLRCGPAKFQHKIIYIGGASQVVDLMVRNASDHFLATSEAVIAVLDGDQDGLSHASKPGVYLAPILSVEKSFYDAFMCSGAFPVAIPRSSFTSAKDFYRYVLDVRLMSKREIFAFLAERSGPSGNDFAGKLANFLGADLLPAPASSHVAIRPLRIRERARSILRALRIWVRNLWSKFLKRVVS